MFVIDNNEFSQIIVGKPFPPAIGRPEGVQLHISPYSDDDLIQMITCYRNPTKDEIRDYKKGNVKIRLYYEDELLFLLFKVGSQNWSEAPFEPRLHKTFEFGNVEPGKGYPMLMMLVDVPSGVVKNLRLISFSTEFSRILKSIIDKLNANREGFSEQQYLKKLAALQNKYTTNDLVERAIVGFELT